MVYGSYLLSSCNSCRVFIQKVFYRVKAMEKGPFASMEKVSELKEY